MEFFDFSPIRRPWRYFSELCACTIGTMFEPTRCNAYAEGAEVSTLGISATGRVGWGYWKLSQTLFQVS